MGTATAGTRPAAHQVRGPRAAALQEKAGLERELKQLRSQAEKLTKNMDKVGVGAWLCCWVYGSVGACVAGCTLCACVEDV